MDKTYTLCCDVVTETASAPADVTRQVLEDLRAAVHPHYTPGFALVRADGSGQAWGMGHSRVQALPAGTFRKSLRPAGEAVVAPPTVLYVRERRGELVVIDPAGGVWWPSEEAAAEIEAAAQPSAEALRICRDEPMRGVWSS